MSQGTVSAERQSSTRHDDQFMTSGTCLVPRRCVPCSHEQHNASRNRRLGGTATTPTIDPKATSKDAALKALDDSFDYGATILKQQTDQTLLQSVASAPTFMGPSSRARIIAFLAGHTWDIYGQLAVYLRLNGHVPPASQRM